MLITLKRTLTAAATLAVISCAAREHKDEFAMASIAEVERMLGQPDVAIIDANPKDVFEQNHLPGAIHYRSAAFEDVLPRDKDQRIVFYCASPS